MLAKFLLLIDGKKVSKPNWKVDENHPFQTADEARDWGDEVTIGAGAFKIISVDGNYSETRTWVKTGITYTGQSSVVSN